MTQKGLAFGAGFALVATGLVALPAQASGIDDGKVRLSPNAGTTYSMLAKETFDLKANFAVAAQSGGDLKFQVDATTGSVDFDVDVNGSTADVEYTRARAITAASVASNVVTVTSANHPFAVGDVLTIGGTTFSDSASADKKGDVTVTAVTADTFTAALTAANGAVTLSAATATFKATSLTAAAISGTSIVYTVGSTRTLLTGDVITVANATPAAGTLNGDRTITAVLSETQFTTAIPSGVSGAISLSSATVTQKTPAASDQTLSTRAALIGKPIGSPMVIGATPVFTAGTNKFVVNTKDATAGGVDAVLRLVAVDATVTTTATVTAWVDDNDNGLIDSTEYRSPARAITFLPNSAVTFNTALDKPLLAGTSLTAVVTITPAINMAQIPSGVVQVDFTKDGSSVVADDDAAYSEDDDALVATQGSLTAFTAGIFAAQAQYDGANRGAINYQTVVSAARDVSSVANASTTASANTAGLNIKTGTTSVTFGAQVSVWGAYGSPSTAVDAPAGIPVRVTIARSVLASTSTVVAGGKTLRATGASSIVFETTTGADGKVSVPVTATGAKNDAITVTFAAEDLDTTATPTSAPSPGTPGYTSNSSQTFTWVDAAATAIVDASTAGGSATRAIARGGSVALEYRLVDQFGAPVTGERRFVFAASGTSAGQVEVSVPQFVISSNGTANVTVTDVSTSLTGTYALGVTVQTKNTSGAWISETGSATTNFVMGGKAVSSITTTDAMLASATKKGLQTVAMVAHDGRAVALGAVPYSTGSSNTFTISGTVRASDGSGIAGVPVTVSASGAGFATADNSTSALFAIGTITVYTQSNGSYSVIAYSNKSGTVEYTVTSGSASVKTSAIYANPAKTAGTNLVVDAPASVRPGSTFRVTATLTDKFGNPVFTGETSATSQIQVAYTGPGIVFGTLPTDTDSKGQIAFSVLLGANDSGTASVAVSYDQSDNGNFTGTTALDKDVTVSKSVNVGTGVAAGTGKVNVGSFNGKLVVYASGLNGARISWKVGGNWGSAVASSNYSIFNRPTPRAGVTVSVDIYVNGVKTLTKSVVTR